MVVSSLLSLRRLWLALLVGLLLHTTASAAIKVTMTDGSELQLRAPAKRIVTLAPHLTEIVFAVKAGDRIVGTTEFSDFPPEAKTIPHVGNAASISLERIIALRPDLVLAWGSGTPATLIKRLREKGIPVYVSEPHKLEHIGTDILNIGDLTGNRAEARAAELAYIKPILAMKRQFSEKQPVRVFYQVWRSPLITLNHEHYLDEAIRWCGGVNVFGHLRELTPMISMEALIRENPDVIIAGGSEAAAPVWHYYWKPWPVMKASSEEKVYFIPADVIARPGPRLVEGMRQLCHRIDLARTIGREIAIPPYDN